MDAAIVAVASRQWGLITRSQLLDLGLSSRAICNRITKERLRVIHPAVYLVGAAPLSWEQQLFAALLASGEASAISHLAAGRFFSLDGVRTEVPHVLLTHERRIYLNGVVIHRTRTLEAGDLISRRGIRVTSVGRALVDLAGVLTLSELENALDDALRRRLVTVALLQRRLDLLPISGVPGAGRLRSLVADRSAGPIMGSPPEARFRRRLARAGLPAPVPQFEVRDAQGKLVARVDFAYPKSRLAIEIDGWRHHSGRRKWESDLARQNRLILAGWGFLRFTVKEADNDPRVIALIHKALGSSTVTG